jgi:hypothetical protein
MGAMKPSGISGKRKKTNPPECPRESGGMSLEKSP